MAATRPADGEASLALRALTAAALALPGLAATPSYAVELEETGVQYSHYEESKRQTYGANSNLKPIQVDSLQTGGQTSLSDRLKLYFNFFQDTWGGATPVATAPLAFGGNHVNSSSGASPYLSLGTVRLDKNLNPLQLDKKTGKYVVNDQLVHTLAMASPETRKQGDFKLGYEWDQAAGYIGGGVSDEHDYQSRYGNLAGRLDLNQKQTTLNLGLSYTNSDIKAIIDHDAAPYIYETSAGLKYYNGTHETSYIDLVGGSLVNNKQLNGNRQDWSSNFSVTQVLNKGAVLSAGAGYARSTGYLANPYKAVTGVFIDPKQKPDASGNYTGTSVSLLEKRPDERNIWTGNLGYVQHVGPLDAAFHADYRFYSDDWGITSQTLQLDWAQPLPMGWSITPTFRYYTQDAADFYTPWLVSFQTYPGKASIVNGKVVINPLDPSRVPVNYSSDQRLSAFGAVSGGVNVSKRFGKAVTVDVAAEYYSHAGSLKLGGGGTGSYADFNYFTVSAALKLDLSAATLPESHDHHDHHHHGNHEHAHAPAGVMFDHMLDQAGDFMVGYRYMYSPHNGDMLHGADGASDYAIVAQGCQGRPCYVTPTNMNMHMHMLDLMYAPTDWLTLMAMPQFMDMNMNMRPLDGAPAIPTKDTLTAAAVMHAYHTHQTGGLGDTGFYALFRVFDYDIHHLHATAGISAPTGDVGITLRDTHGLNIGFIHYGMQLGSGTWDFKPSLTYTGHTGRWSWGAQLAGVKRLEQRNTSGFAFGDILQTTAWGGYRLYDWLDGSFRAAYIAEGSLSGVYNDTYAPIGPMDYGVNYGGHFWDLGFGLSAKIPTGSGQGSRLSVEWIQPVYDNPNGFQLPRVGAVAATWSYAF